MKSTIGELINHSIPSIKNTASVGDALNMIADADMEAIVVLSDGQVLGVAEDVELEDVSPGSLISDINISNKFQGVSAQLHIYDAMKLMSNNAWDIIPVLSDERQFLGAVNVEDVKSELVENLAYRASGAIVILRQLETDYSLSEIIRICESNDCRVMSVGTQKEEDSRAVIITLKLDKKDISSVIASFTRYEYEIVASYGDNMYNEDLKDRLDLLMHYINM